MVVELVMVVIGVVGGLGEEYQVTVDASFHKHVSSLCMAIMGMELDWRQLAIDWQTHSTAWDRAATNIRACTSEAESAGIQPAGQRANSGLLSDQALVLLLKHGYATMPATQLSLAKRQTTRCQVEWILEPHMSQRKSKPESIA